MVLTQNRVEIDRENGGVILSDGDKRVARLHPLWIRERVNGPLDFDPISHQRLYEHAELPADMIITHVNPTQTDSIEITFSDGYHSQLALGELVQELGWSKNPESPPEPQSWDARLNSRPEFDWNALETPEHMKDMLESYFTNGYCVMQNLSLIHISSPRDLSTSRMPSSA